MIASPVDGSPEDCPSLLPSLSEALPHPATRKRRKRWIHIPNRLLTPPPAARQGDAVVATSAVRYKKTVSVDRRDEREQEAAGGSASRLCLPVPEHDRSRSAEGEGVAADGGAG